MKTNIGGGIFHFTKYVLFLFFIFVQSCASTSVMRLEGSDFKENLVGQWEGHWHWRARHSGKVRIKISKIDGNKVYLTGFNQGYPSLDTDEVYGRIENSTLLLSWPLLDCTHEYIMKKVDSNNLILDDGHLNCDEGNFGSVQLKKIE